jgi:hypothetical protein
MLNDYAREGASEGEINNFDFGKPGAEQLAI